MQRTAKGKSPTRQEVQAVAKKQKLAEDNGGSDAEVQASAKKQKVVNPSGESKQVSTICVINYVS